MAQRNPPPLARSPANRFIKKVDAFDQKHSFV
jgi:hypothetical protein